MGMRTVNDPCSSRAPLVDKLIGNAYEIVKYVAMNLTTIRYVAENMELVHQVGTNLKQTAVLNGTTGIAGATVSVALPTGVTAGQVIGSQVMIQTSEGDLYGDNSGHFTSNIQGGMLRLTLGMSAPAGLQSASFRWFLTYTE